MGAMINAARAFGRAFCAAARSFFARDQAAGMTFGFGRAVLRNRFADSDDRVLFSSRSPLFVRAAVRHLPLSALFCIGNDIIGILRIVFEQ